MTSTGGRAPAGPVSGLTRRSSFALAIGGLFAATARAAAADPAAAPSGWDAVDALANKVIDDRVAPGLSLSVMRRGHLVYSSGFGMANLETATRVTPQSVFKIGSITKQFTASAIMLLQEDGKLSVDDKLSRFIPEFTRANEISLRQMLSHTSGLGNYTNTHPPEKILAEMRIDYDAPAMLKLMESTDPLYSSEPGTRWAYSNTAFVLLGLVIEKVTGKPYAETFTRRLFEPAGLNDTAVDKAADVVPHRASGYSPHPGAEGLFDNCSFISMTVPGAAGNLRSTADDLCRWHRALFAGKIVKPESLAEMVKPARLKTGELPSMPAGGPATAPRVIEYGFGLQIDHVADHPAIGHGGGINGFGSHVETFVPEEVSVALLVNMDGGRALGARSTALRTALAKAGLGLS